MDAHPSPSPDEDGPLAGVRVVDLTSILMGPLAARILADLGADVIRVEEPGGDAVRNYAPMRSEHMSWFAMNLHRGKRSVVLDLKSTEGAAAMAELVASADVLVTNVRAGALDRLGLGWGDLHPAHPRLIYCLANGFGQDGPYRDRTAYDDVVQAATGLAAMPTWFGRDPAFVPAVVGDKVAALHIVYAVNAALYRRERTGVGERIEVPMAEAVAAFNLVEHLGGHTYEPPEGPFGYERLLVDTRRPRRVADDWICFLPYSDQNWRDFWVLAGREDLLGDPRFADRPARARHADDLYDIVDALLLTRTLAEWLAALEAASIPAAPVRRMEDLGDDPHFAAVGLLSVLDHPSEGAYRHVKDPVTFSGGTAGLRRFAPRLGQHTDEVLAELRDRRAGGSPPPPR